MGGGWRPGPSRLFSSWCLTFVRPCHAGQLSSARGVAAVKNKNCTAVKQTARKRGISFLSLLLFEGERPAAAGLHGFAQRWLQNTHLQICCFAMQVEERTCRLCVRPRCPIAAGSEPVTQSQTDHSNLIHKKYKHSNFSSLCRTKYMWSFCHMFWHYALFFPWCLLCACQQQGSVIWCAR